MRTLVVRAGVVLILLSGAGACDGGDTASRLPDTGAALPLPDAGPILDASPPLADASLLLDGPTVAVDTNVIILVSPDAGSVSLDAAVGFHGPAPTIPRFPNVDNEPWAVPMNNSAADWEHFTNNPDLRTWTSPTSAPRKLAPGKSPHGLARVWGTPDLLKYQGHPFPFDPPPYMIAAIQFFDDTGSSRGWGALWFSGISHIWRVYCRVNDIGPASPCLTQNTVTTPLRGGLADTPACLNCHSDAVAPPDTSPLFNFMDGRPHAP
jgi:hypothetical protein